MKKIFTIFPLLVVSSLLGQDNTTETNSGWRLFPEIRFSLVASGNQDQNGSTPASFRQFAAPGGNTLTWADPGTVPGAGIGNICAGLGAGSTESNADVVVGLCATRPMFGGVFERPADIRSSTIPGGVASRQVKVRKNWKFPGVYFEAGKGLLFAGGQYTPYSLSSHFFVNNSLVNEATITSHKLALGGGLRFQKVWGLRLGLGGLKDKYSGWGLAFIGSVNVRPFWR